MYASGTEYTPFSCTRFIALSIMCIVMSGNKDEISFFVKDEDIEVRIFIFSDVCLRFRKYSRDGHLKNGTCLSNIH